MTEVNIMEEITTSRHAESLAEAGFSSLEQLARARLDDIIAIPGIGEKTAIDLIGSAQARTGIGTSMSATDFLDAYDTGYSVMSATQTTDSNVDAMLGGGYRTKKNYLFYAHEGAGKTQFICQAIANCIAPKSAGGEERNAFFIDMENVTYEVLGRTKSMLEAKGVDARECFEARLDVDVCNNTDMQFASVNRVLKSNKEYGLLVLDGIMTKTSIEYAGRANVNERQMKLGKHLNDIEAFCIEKNAVVIATTQVYDKPDAMFTDPVTPKGGHVVLHNFKYIVKLRKGKKVKGVQQGVARLVKSPDLPETEATYIITEGGIIDGEE